jgi:Zn ribbon nucleic-acid-binding protein
MRDKEVTETAEDQASDQADQTEPEAARVLHTGEGWVLGRRERCPMCPPSFTGDTLALSPENGMVQCEACGWTSLEASAELVKYLLSTHRQIADEGIWDGEAREQFALADWVRVQQTTANNACQYAQLEASDAVSALNAYKVQDAEKGTEPSSEVEPETEPEAEMEKKTKSHARKKAASEGEAK